MAIESSVPLPDEHLLGKNSILSQFVPGLGKYCIA